MIKFVMLNATNNPFMLSVIMFSVIMLSVVAPHNGPRDYKIIQLSQAKPTQPKLSDCDIELEQNISFSNDKVHCKNKMRLKFGALNTIFIGPLSFVQVFNEI